MNATSAMLLLLNLKQNTLYTQSLSIYTSFVFNVHFEFVFWGSVLLHKILSNKVYFNNLFYESMKYRVPLATTTFWKFAKNLCLEFCIQKKIAHGPFTMKMINRYIPNDYHHAFLSALTSKSHIMKHYGPTNKKLRFHLPLMGVKHGSP